MFIPWSVKVKKDSDGKEKKSLVSVSRKKELRYYQVVISLPTR